MKGFGENKKAKKRKIKKKEEIVNIDQLINKAFKLQAQGKKLEAAKYYLYLIENGEKTIEFFRIMEYF